MNAIDYINKFLLEMLSKFPEMKFRCEKKYDTYLIETSPLGKSNDWDFIEYEEAFIQEFENKYVGDMITFVTEDSLNKILNPVLEVGYYRPKIQKSNNFNLGNFDMWVSECGNFADAA